MKAKQFGNPDVMLEPFHVGVDPSLTGFAVCALNDKGFYAEVWTPSTRGAERLHELRSEFLMFTTEIGPCESLAMEGTVRQSASASVLGELAGVVKQAWWEARGEEVLCCPPMSLKKYVTGKGNGIAKSVMMMKVFQKWGVEITDDNAADAYGLARIAAGLADTVYEKDVLKKVKR